MGFSFGTLWHYRWLGKAGKIPKGASVLDFGSQNIHGTIDILHAREFMSVFGTYVPDDKLRADVAPGVKIEHLMRDAGFDYTAFDVYSDGATRIFDLNRDLLASEERERYDVVANCGTSEHVANQFNVFKVAHEALKVGGVMLNFVPFYGEVDHGLINYHPKFFTSLIANNSYEPLYFGLSGIFSGGGGIDRYRQVSRAHNGAAWEGKIVGCAEMCVIWQKTKASAFQPPSDVSDRAGGYLSVNQLLSTMGDYSVFQEALPSVRPSVLRRWREMLVRHDR